MPSPSHPNDIHDDVGGGAIFTEIADRLLRTAFAGKTGRLPPRITMPVEQTTGNGSPTVRGHSVSDGVD